MFTVTEEAAHALRSMMDQADDRPEGHTLRIGIDQRGQPGLLWDEPAEGDREVQVEGETVLLVDNATQDALDDVILDVQETDEGPALSLSRQES